MLIKDNVSGHSHVYFLKYKNEAVDRLKEHCVMVNTQLNKAIKRLRCDNGLEFCNEEFSKVF